MFSTGAEGRQFDRGLIALAIAFDMTAPPLQFLMYLPPFCKGGNPSAQCSGSLTHVRVSTSQGSEPHADYCSSRTNYRKQTKLSTWEKTKCRHRAPSMGIGGRQRRAHTDPGTAQLEDGAEIKFLP